MSQSDDAILDSQLDRALNRLAKWRAHFTGWQLGTRLKGDPEGDAVRDHREVTILLRAEVNALTAALCKMDASFQRAFREELLHEAQILAQHYAEKFPGITATDDGLSYDRRAIETMKGYKR